MNDLGMPVPEGSAMLADLANSDGWFALYDPANPITRDISADILVSLSDALGNLPDFEVHPNGKGPIWDPQAFRNIGGMRYGRHSSAALGLDGFARLVEFPCFVMVLAQSDGVAFLEDGICGSEKNTADTTRTGQSREAALKLGGGEPAEEYATEATNDPEAHVFGFQTVSSGSMTACRYFVDGKAEDGDFQGAHPATINSVGLRLGGSAEGFNGSWSGVIGPVLIYRGIPSVEVRGRMTRLLLAIVAGESQIAVDMLSSREAILMEQDGSLSFEKGADELDLPASLTKMLTQYVARQTITDSRLDEKVTLTSSEKLTGSKPRLYPGDIVTYRDLFHLASMPSHNVAAELIAKLVGQELPGDGTGRDRFLQKMADTIAGWGWNNAEFHSASGLGKSNRATPRQMGELLWRIANEDSTLLAIMGTLAKDIKVEGTRPRTLAIKHSIPVDGEPAFPEFIAGKTGTLLRTIGNVAMLVEVEGIRRVVVTMGAPSAGGRYPDARRVLDGQATNSVRLSPRIVRFENTVLQALENPDSPLRERLDAITANGQVRGPVSVNFPDADLTARGAHMSVSRSGASVELVIAAVKLPPRGTAPRAVPRGYRPQTFAYGTATVRDGSNVRLVEVRVSSAGRISVYGNSADDLLRGTISWLTRE